MGHLGLAMERIVSSIFHLGPSVTNGNDRFQVGKLGIMLTEAQVIAVAEFLVAHTPGGNDELEHSHICAWLVTCEALAAPGYATGMIDEPTRVRIEHRSQLFPDRSTDAVGRRPW
ncbi:MAG: hypothetical protein V2I24_16785 [Halieaceae bacterium]|nr:hypothetical protein [Halieaceae bacterium]